jgi:hypothetical protein
MGVRNDLASLVAVGSDIYCPYDGSPNKNALKTQH